MKAPRLIAIVLFLCCFMSSNLLPADSFIRGDSNADGDLNLADAVHTLSFLFAFGEPIDCMDAADSNDSGQVNLADAIYLLSYLFSDGSPPPSPFHVCGEDQTGDALACDFYPRCAGGDPETIDVAPADLIFSRVGASYSLTVTGNYPDGSTFNITNANTGTLYTASAEGIVEVSDEGVVTAVGVGSVALTIEHGACSASIPVIVASENLPSVSLGYVPGEALVLLEPSGSAEAIASRHDLTILEIAELSALGFTAVRFKAPTGTPIETLLEELNGDPDVDVAEYNRIIAEEDVEYNDPLLETDQYGFFQIHAHEAHEIATGKGVRVAVVDSGLDMGHPEFAGRIPVEDRYDAVENDNDPTDMQNGHGTHVAGIIGASTDNGIGMSGIAPDAELIIARSGNRGTHETMNLIKCINFAVSRGADVINMSVGLAIETHDKFNNLQALQQRCLHKATRQGATIVSSAGNNQVAGSPVSLPASLHNVIAVGAVDETETVTNFSNLRHYVDVVAPGMMIVSTFPRPLTSSDDEDGLPVGYAYRPGTSMAAPHVAGVVALMKEVNPGLSPCEVQAILEKTAVDLGIPGKDPQYGSGLVDAHAAVLAAADPDALLGASCDLALIQGGPKTDIHQLEVTFDPANVTSSSLNSVTVPWQTATSIEADGSGRLYITALGEDGATTGVYRLDHDGTIHPVCIGFPFENPAGITIDREGNCLVVDAAAPRIIHLTPGGQATVIHEGEPLVHPTEVDYTNFGSWFVISDFDDASGTGRIHLFKKDCRSFQLLEENSWDYNDLASFATDNTLCFAVAAFGEEDGAGISNAAYSNIENVVSYAIGEGGLSMDEYTGISMDYNGDYWITDRGIAEPDGVLMWFSVNEEGSLDTNGVRLSSLSEPEDIVQIPPSSIPVTPPELIYIVSEHVYLNDVGAQRQISVQGKLSNDMVVSVADLLERGEITFESMNEAVATVDARGIVTGHSTGLGLIKVAWKNLEKVVVVFVGATGIQIRHPVNSRGQVDHLGDILEPGDFSVPHGSYPIALEVVFLFSNGNVMTLEKKVADNHYSTSNPTVVALGLGQVQGNASFDAAGKSEITVINGPFSDTIEITVEGPDPVTVTGVEIQEEAVAIVEGASHELQLVTHFSNGKRAVGLTDRYQYDFISDDTSVAQVGAFDGIVTGINAGTTVVTVSKETYTDTVVVTVEPANLPPNGIITAPGLDVTRHVLSLIPLRGEATDPDGTIAHAFWNFAGGMPNLTGEEPGLVSFMEAGTYTVTFMVTDDGFATDPSPESRTITILAHDVMLESVEIAEEDFELPIGDTLQLTVLGHYSDGSTHYLSASMSRTSYETTDASSASVSTDGLVTGVSPGAATVTAENGTFSDSIIVSVVEPQAVLESIAITDGDITLEEAFATEQLEVMGYYSDDTTQVLTMDPKTVYSSNSPSASVSQNGLVTAHETGEAVITAYFEGFSDSIVVTVDLPVAPAPQLSFYFQKNTINEGEIAYLFWSSENATYVVIEPDIGTALPNARFIPVRPGEETVYTATAYGPGGTDTASDTIEVVPAPSVSLEKITKLGGHCRSAALSGQTLFVQKGGTVESVDVSTPASPAFVGRIDLTCLVSDLVVDGDYLYVTDDQGLSVIDVSDPSDMKRVGGIAGLQLAKLAVSNGFVYAASGSAGFWTIDISDPENPLPAGHFCPEGWTASTLAVSGQLAAVAGWGGGVQGLHVIDLSDPRDPVLAGMLETTDSPAGVALSGDTAYMALGNLLVVDLSDPSDPVSRGSVSTDWSIDHVSCNGQTVYASDMKNTLFVVNAGNPDSPVITGSLALEYECHKTLIKDNLAFLAAENLTIASVAGVDPSIVGCYPAIHQIQTMESGYDSVYAGGGTGISRINCTDPESPGAVAHWTGNEAFKPFVFDIAIGHISAGSHRVYAVDPTEGMMIFDSSLDSLVGRLHHPALYYNQTVSASPAGDYVYVGNTRQGVITVDISDPTDPQHIASATTSGSGFSSMDLFQNKLYLAKNTSGLTVFDLSDPAAPVAEGTLRETAYSVSTAGHAVIMGSNSGELLSVNAQNPDEPAGSVFFDFGTGAGNITDVCIANGLIFAVYDRTLAVLDLASQDGDVLKGKFNTRYEYDKVTVRGPYVYIGGTEGVTVLRMKYKADDIVVPESGSVIVTYKSKDAAYINEFWLEEPRIEHIFTATDENVGNTYDLGRFEEGDTLRFALKNPHGWTFYTDPALNLDANYDHVILKQIDPLTWEIYWEDTAYLRLLDYQDVVVRIEIVP